MAVPGTNEGADERAKITRAARSSVDFYWNRDKAWPYAGARLALIAKPWTPGFDSTSATVQAFGCRP